MNNFILGSGVIGYVAKEIFGWELIPFKKSRFYSFEIPYADNYVVFDKNIDEFIKKLFPSAYPVIMKSFYSFKGGLISDDPILKEMYIDKAYKSNPNPNAKNLIKLVSSIYNISIMDLHNLLYKKFLDEINQNISNFGEVTSVDLDNRTINCKKKKIEYDNIISTIPLNALCKYTGKSMELPSLDLYVYHLMSTVVDLEGAIQCYVCDEGIEFYKVQKIGNNEYLFWSNSVIEQPHKYFGMCFGYNFEILEVVQIRDAIPLGVVPDLSDFANSNVFCVGGNAQWDDFMDISSSIKRLLRKNMA